MVEPLDEQVWWWAGTKAQEAEYEVECAAELYSEVVWESSRFEVPDHIIQAALDVLDYHERLVVWFRMLEMVAHDVIHGF
jgi:hypothetical protein